MRSCWGDASSSRLRAPFSRSEREKPSPCSQKKTLFLTLSPPPTAGFDHGPPGDASPVGLVVGLRGGPSPHSDGATQTSKYVATAAVGGFGFSPTLLCQSDASPLHVQSLAATVVYTVLRVCVECVSMLSSDGRWVFQPSLSVLYMLSDGATHEAVHLLCRMLVFDPVSLFRWSSPGRSMVTADIRVARRRRRFTCFSSVSRPNGSPAATRSPTRTWTRVACATTPACVSAATPSPAGEFTRATLSRWRSGRSATATRTACCQCGRAKVRRRHRRRRLPHARRVTSVADFSLSWPQS